MDLSRDGKRRSYESSAHWPSEGPNMFRRLDWPPGRDPRREWYPRRLSAEAPQAASEIIMESTPEDGARGLEAMRRVTARDDQRTPHLESSAPHARVRQRTLRGMGYAGVCGSLGRSPQRERERARVAASQRIGESSAGCGRRKALPPLLHRSSPTRGVGTTRIHHADHAHGLPGWHPAARSSMDGLSLNPVHAPTHVFRRMTMTPTDISRQWAGSEHPSLRGTPQEAERRL